MNWRLYTALYYLKKGNYEAFYDLLLIENYKNKILNIESNKDLLFLNNEGYIEFKDKEIIILTKKSEELLNRKKEDKEEITNEFISKFLKGFPSNRYSNKKKLIEELILFIKKYNYNLETILKAKEKYLLDNSNTNYLYVYNSINFIKNKLEEYCAYVQISEEKEINNVTINGNFMI